ncbi:MAG: hypothetical protein CXZ00_15560 [Acidobacteria bacterium]|nr:MAG: hypothetical protein CXZ00_15560 [Acidobacteriota bacterium]
MVLGATFGRVVIEIGAPSPASKCWHWLPTDGSFGNAPGYLAELRYPHMITEDIGLHKTLTFGEDER